MLLLCSGPGAALTTTANEVFGLYSLLFCGGGALLILGLCLRRRRLLPLLALGLVAAHPYWWVGTTHGDCGYELRAFAQVAAIVMAGLLLWTFFRLLRRRNKTGVA